MKDMKYYATEKSEYEYQVVISFASNLYVNYERTQSYAYVENVYNSIITELKDLPCTVLLNKVKGSDKASDVTLKSTKLNMSTNILSTMKRLNKEYKKYIIEYEKARKKIAKYDSKLNKFYHVTERDNSLNRYVDDNSKVKRMDEFLEVLEERRKNKSKLYLYENLTTKITELKETLLNENSDSYVGEKVSLAKRTLK